jgi:predicted HNH restriction endonuclease
VSPRSQAERDAYRRRIHAYERTPAWRVRSAKFRRTHGPVCDACGVVTDRNNPLHAHHRTYPRALNGRERDKDLRGLCALCHRKVHDLARRRVSLEVATDRVIRDGRRGRMGWFRRLVRWATGL